MYVLNKCRVDFKYRLSAFSPVISKTSSSNIVFTQIINEKIKINKFVDKEEAGLYNLLKYTVVISNISNEKVENLYFTDNIPKGTSFLQNSLTINNIKKRCLNPELGFYIEDLDIKEKVEITFKVIILKSQYKYIKNTSNIEYDYIYNIEEKPIRRSKESNTVKTKFENNLFKQIILRNTIKLTSNIESIIKVMSVPKIISVKLINCYVKEQCGLLIFGKINYLIFYKSNGVNYFTEDVSGFSICMVAPIGISYLNKVDIKINKEYTCTKLINKNTIFINTSILIYC